jgi:menaquinone-dependent protoporphyrinogen oxidase
VARRRSITAAPPQSGIQEDVMNMLVVVASKHGSTRDIANTIAEELRAAQFAVDLQDAHDVADLRGYDAVVLGSAIYAGSWLPAAKRFAEQHRAQLATLPVWVFSSGPLGAANPQPHDDPARLAAPLGDIPIRDHRIFVGKLDRDDLGVAERMIAKVVKAPFGDFRDWDAVRAWAHDIAAALQPAGVLPHAGS